MLLPMFDALAKTLGVAAEAVHYSGESRGSGAKKCYRLTIDGRTNDVWVKVVRKKKLVQVPESEVPKSKKGGGKKNGGKNAGGGNPDGGDNGGGSGNPGGNKPGSGGQGGATITPKE